MAIYCEGAKAAEVIFSLTGGREGKVFSVNPPVEIKTGVSGLICRLKLLELIAGDNWYPEYQVGGEIVGTTPLFSNFIEIFPYQSLGVGCDTGKFPYKYSLVRSTRLPGEDIKSEILSNFTNNRRPRLIKQYYSSFYLYGKVNNLQGSSIVADQSSASMFLADHTFVSYKNAFVVSDTTGVIYSQEFPKEVTPTYKVNCITCPPGLCACRGKGEKIHCVDCRKVINGLNNASRGIDAVYG